uniref:Equatorin n=1 Tax=Otolemur garnettii TaxID=30611 RepID=H0XG23_OTOGA
MSFILFILLSGVFSSESSTLRPTMSALPTLMSSSEDAYREAEEKYKEEAHTGIPANEKTGDHYKDIKQCKFITHHSSYGLSSHVLIRCTSLKTINSFSLFLDKPNKATRYDKPTTEEEESQETYHNSFQKSTPNVPAFWTMLAKALNGSAVYNMDEKDQLFHLIPRSDLLMANDDKISELEELKIKLMLGISLMTLFLFLILLGLCCATLFKLKRMGQNDYESQYSINPELATMSYFHPSEGVSDTSFSKSAESSTLWGNTSSDMRSTSPRTRSKATDMISTGSEDISLNDESDLL